MMDGGYDNGSILSVRDFGAVGDGIHDDTDAFVQGIERIEKNGGGRLIVVGSQQQQQQQQQQQHSQEMVYNIRPINLTSHMELVIEEGARIRGIAGVSLWPILPALPSYGQGRDHVGPRHTSLIHGEHLVNVTIRGQNPKTSIIDGNGEYWWKRHNAPNQPETTTRGSLIEFMYTADLRIYDIGLQNSPFWTVHPYDCDNVHIRGVEIVNPQHTPNTDGFDPDSSRNVLIEDSSYVGGDDCVAIKSGWDCFGVDYGTPARDITIRNLTCWVNAIALGSEISGGIENIYVEHLHFPNGTYHPVKLKTGKSRGGYIRNVTIRDVRVAGNLKGSAIDIDMNLYSGGQGMNPSCPTDWTPPQDSIVEDLTFVDWNGMTSNFSTAKMSAFDFLGMSPESPVRNVFLQDLYFPETGTWKCSHIANITAVNGTITPWPPCEGVRIIVHSLEDEDEDEDMTSKLLGYSKGSSETSMIRRSERISTMSAVERPILLSQFFTTEGSLVVALVASLVLLLLVIPFVSKGHSKTNTIYSRARRESMELYFK